jgi:hypothetical protein
MPRKVDLNALLEKRARHFKRMPRLQQMDRRYFELFRAFKAAQGAKSIARRSRRELCRYFPIALVALIEGYLKMLYRDLIDSGEPFLSNAKNFRDIRASLDALIETRKNTLSLGEFISEQLSHNSLGQIESNLGILLGQDFGFEFTRRLKQDDAEAGHTVFQTHLRRVLVELFRQRHVFCHELAPRAHADPHLVETMFKVTRVFLQIVEEHVWELTGRDREVELRKLRRSWKKIH